MGQTNLYVSKTGITNLLNRVRMSIGAQVEVSGASFDNKN